MDDRAVAAAMRLLEAQIGAEKIVMEGNDGSRLTLDPALALHAFMQALGGNDDLGLPMPVADWIRLHGIEGAHDLTGLLVRTYRAGMPGNEKETTT